MPGWIWQNGWRSLIMIVKFSFNYRSWTHLGPTPALSDIAQLHLALYHWNVFVFLYFVNDYSFSGSSIWRPFLRNISQTAISSIFYPKIVFFSTYEYEFQILYLNSCPPKSDKSWRLNRHVSNQLNRFWLKITNPSRREDTIMVSISNNLYFIIENTVKYRVRTNYGGTC